MQWARTRAHLFHEADDKLRALKTFEGSTCSFIAMADHQSPTHMSWDKGLMGTRSYVSLRCLMPLGVAWEIIQSADRERFRVNATIQVDIGRLSHENQTTSVYWLTKQKLIPSSLADLFGSRIITKTIEFSLNFNEQMHRIQLSPFGGDHEGCGRYIEMLSDALVSEKHRQMQIEDARPPLPWEVKDVWGMPVVLWIHKRQYQ